MSKRLVICCDGTWNRSDQTRNGVISPTNVWKIHKGVAEQAPDGTAQRTHYEEGVGVARFQRLLGGALGYGLSRNVQDAYRWILENYDDGDELFLFGFSRGAFTARSCAGLLRNAGILRSEHADRVEAAYDLYRSGRPEHEPEGAEAIRFRKQWSHPDADITFIGVWDTVGSLGVPITGVPFITRRWSFHDTKLSGRVKHAHHALAIDERRRPFEPTLWEQPRDAPKDQVLQQRWFTGVHCDVGGGYPDPDLADLALEWMADRARGAGLEFRPGHFTKAGKPTPAERATGARISPDPLGKHGDSFKSFYRLQRPIDRVLEGDHCDIAPSAIERYDADPEYRPRKLKEFLRR